jgi:putative ABC transport system substrate-binding protein
MAGQSRLFKITTVGEIRPKRRTVSQQVRKVHRVGVLSDTARREATESRWRDALRQLGYVEGENLELLFVWADERFERFPGLLAELMRSNVEIILTISTPAAMAAKQATTTIPIVTMSAQPVAAGLVASLARPGGNVTGVFLPHADMAAKRLQLLKEIVPGLDSVAIVSNPENSATVAQADRAKAAARELDITAQVFELRALADVEPVMAAIVAKRAPGLVVMQDPIVCAAVGKLAALAAKHRLPASYPYTEFVDGLLSYGVSLSGMFAMAADYADKLLKGAKPSELPMRQPRKTEMVINLKTAKAMGITIPQGVLARADEVIQ